MSWDRVIQDSDEDEPLGDDGVDAPASIETLQDHECPKQQLLDNLGHHVDEQQANYPIEQQAAEEVGTEPDLGVNFDQFLQSQDMSQSATTLSQQRREERWIPSTGQVGGGSIGAMMTEIGHAQRRLLDDDPSSAGQLLPSTATQYPSEISQPGSYPTIPSYPYEQVNEVPNEDYTYTRPIVEDSYEATQLLPQVHANGYEYSTPATSNNVESPLGDANERTYTISTSVQLNDDVHANSPHKTVQRSRSMQSQMWSPHDTEPMSSVVSRGLTRSKSDNSRSGLMSPQHSAGSAHDELALSMVTPTTVVDASAVKKKRVRPKKQSLPEDDEEDELAAPRNYFDSEWRKTAEKRRRESPSKNQDASKRDIIEINDDADDPSTREAKPHHVPRLMVVLPVAFDNKSKSNDANGSTESGTAATKPPKKKVKRSKTASAVLDKPKGAAVDDDVIWLDSNPLQVDETKPTEQAGNPHKAQDAPQVTPVTPRAEEAPAPKKRGRRRKKPVEAIPVSEEQPQPSDPEPTISDNAPTIEENQDSIPEPQNETPDAAPHLGPATTNEPPPQTPHRAEGKENDPATGKASHKGPTKHSPILSTTKVPYRVGLSKRARITPLLKVVRK
ncbi:uncharacterized protein N7496_007397 [Penicillium cataractarum]|uniref:Uncharacterized protein n=1 Tax=Penicillium cataractarum TaxID=2100454 RepID=A0A9W9V9G1_9EURO|nr:uncharacterized protein N7496_007397 [Penicillium cataractarum]KAJ5371305.1 hypothetical protein N7496_007397 [Penicillium cataractarum]